MSALCLALWSERPIETAMELSVSTFFPYSLSGNLFLFYSFFNRSVSEFDRAVFVHSHYRLADFFGYTLLNCSAVDNSSERTPLQVIPFVIAGVAIDVVRYFVLIRVFVYDKRIRDKNMRVWE